MNKRSLSTGTLGFSLLELLIITAIMAILALTALPAIVGMSSSGQLTSAGNLIVGLANQARQNAITDDTMTALVRVSSSSSQPQLNNRLFILMELTPAASATGSPTWTPVSKWEILPPGTVVDPSVMNQSPSPTLATPLPSLNYKGTAISSSDCAYQVFLPSGGLLSPVASVNTPPFLRLVTGAMNGSNITYTGNKSAGIPSNYYEVTINPYTGMLKVTRP